MMQNVAGTKPYRAIEVNGYLSQIREGQNREMRGMGIAYHILWPRYSGPLNSTVPGYGKPIHRKK